MNAIKAERPAAGFGFFLAWVLATTFASLVGTVVGLILVGLIGVLLRPNSISPAIGIVIVDTVFGACAGLAQWLVLRGRLRHAGWWAPVSTVSSLLFGLMVGFVFPVAGETLLVIVARGFLGGLIVSLPQWLILRADAEGASWWVVIRTAYSLAAGVAVEAIRGQAPPPLAITLGIETVEILLGAIVSGLVLVYLLRRPREERRLAGVMAA